MKYRSKTMPVSRWILLRMGGVCGFIAPVADAARSREWLTLDVELVGRRVTVVRNGTTLIEAQEIPDGSMTAR